MDLDEDRIGMVVVRASELRSKISNCIRKTASQTEHYPIEEPIAGNNGDDRSSTEAAADADEEAESLLNICDAFESLESHLCSLQALQQQHQYEREAAIGEIEYSRKVLLKKLEEYKGENLDVIEEASTFASMKVEHDNELLLPPYPNQAPRPLILDNGRLPSFSCARKPVQSGHSGAEQMNEARKNVNRDVWQGLRLLVNSVAKTMLTLVGAVSVLSLAGLEPRLVKRGADSRVFGLFQQPNTGEKRRRLPCQPGKVAIVKERVEIPFDSFAGKPDVNYGCG
ncbi:hypothetical protein Nepgr_025401 [Nepenthes gracilis]|uniref:Plastid division protein PDV2 n=1 Tax=Nepenthes gracilis TaxID=150966 RepID=A0AAD3T675_NEPGR|nr:hypothetical protein Nepgr_025401 [Nepenthes gracilis]